LLLRLLTYNIHKCIGGLDRRYRPERIVAVLEHYQPDLVLLQEVDRGAKRSKGHKQVDFLGERLGLRHRVWFPNVAVRGGGEYGNAILSRHPFTRVANIDVTVRPKKRRSVLYARCRVRLAAQDGSTRIRTVHVYNAHLGLSGFERATQLKRFLKSHPLRGLHKQTPVVLAGDFNDVWGTLGPRLLAPAGFHGGSQKTFPAYAPVRALDGVFVRGGASLVRVRSGRIAAARQASDHLPLIADVELRHKPAT